VPGFGSGKFPDQDLLDRSSGCPGAGDYPLGCLNDRRINHFPIERKSAISIFRVAVERLEDTQRLGYRGFIWGKCFLDWRYLVRWMTCLPAKPI
jgi:hypothetical protein